MAMQDEAELVILGTSGERVDGTTGRWQRSRPYLDACIQSFGPERLSAGSDWPVRLVPAGYAQWWHTLASYFAAFSEFEQQALSAPHARTTYRLSHQN